MTTDWHVAAGVELLVDAPRRAGNVEDHLRAARDPRLVGLRPRGRSRAAGGAYALLGPTPDRRQGSAARPPEPKPPTHNQEQL
jgi:hypothetical protein